MLYILWPSRAVRQPQLPPFTYFFRGRGLGVVSHLYTLRGPNFNSQTTNPNRQISMASTRLAVGKLAMKPRSLFKMAWTLRTQRTASTKKRVDFSKGQLVFVYICLPHPEPASARQS